MSLPMEQLVEQLQAIVKAQPVGTVLTMVEDIGLTFVEGGYSLIQEEKLDGVWKDVLHRQ